MQGWNDAILRKYTEDVTQKCVNATDAPDLVLQFIEFEALNRKLLNYTSAYELANSLKSYKFWYDKRNFEPNTKFKPNSRDVYYVDLGAFKIKYEEGFLHPCLIIKTYGDKALVVPGSTKKFGKGGFLIEDVVAGDGFVSNTGLLMDQIRCVSTTRIQGLKLGRMKLETFKRIENKLFDTYLVNKKAEFEKLKNDKTQLEADCEVLNRKIEDLSKQLDELNKKNNELTKDE